MRRDRFEMSGPAREIYDVLKHDDNWINAAIRAGAAGGSVLFTETYIGAGNAVIAEAMRREDYQVADEYRQMVEALTAEAR